MPKKRKTVLAVSKKDIEFFGLAVPHDKFIGVASAIFAGITIIVLLSLVYSSFVKIQVEKDFVDDPEIQRIDTLQASLSEVDVFLQEERQSLIDSKVAQAEFETERQQLEEVLETDKETIDALFEVQEARLQRRIWRERIFGVLLGFLTSLGAALTYGAVQRSLKKDKKTK